MADYYPLISRAVAGLERNTGENRRSLYERARNALLDQLRNVTPALSESDITRERLALEEAIRKVESDVARRMREETPRASAPPVPRFRDLPRTGLRPSPAPSPDAGPAAPADAPAAPPPPPPLGTRPPFGRIVGRSDITAADLRRFPRRPPEPTPPERKPPEPKPFEARQPESKPLEPRPPESKAPEPKPPEPVPGDDMRALAPEPAEAPIIDEAPPAEPPLPESIPVSPPVFVPPPEPRFGGNAGVAARAYPERRPKTEPAEDMDLAEEAAPAAEEQRQRSFAPLRPLEPPIMMEGVRPPTARARRPVVEEKPREKEKVGPGAIRRFVGSSVGTVLIGILLIGLVGGGLFWQRNAIKSGFVSMLSLARGPSTQAPQNATAPGRSKIPDRIGQAGQQPQPSDQPKDQAASTAQHVVLYEEDPNDSNGKRYDGTVVWSLENVAAGPGQPMDKAIRGDIVIPERNMTVTFTIRRNTDKDLPASHTVSIVFTLPADFSHGGIQELRALLMKQSESTRGVALQGLSVKVTTGFFLIGLSATEGDIARNIQMLKDRGWFDIAIVYNDNRRAIMAVEKGPQGDRVFNDAFAAWGQ